MYWGFLWPAEEAAWRLSRLAVPMPVCGYALVKPDPGMVKMSGCGFHLCLGRCLCISCIHVRGCFLGDVACGCV